MSGFVVVFLKFEKLNLGPSKLKTGKPAILSAESVYTNLVFFYTPFCL